MADTGSTWGKRGLYVVAFLVAFFVVQSLTQYWLDKRSASKAVAAVDQEMNRLREAASKKYPNEPAAEAMKREWAKELADKLASQAGDKAKQAQTAADQFMGFLLVNTRMRVVYCKEQGVDIAPFKEAFESAHKSEVVRTAAILAQRGRDMAKDEEKLYALLESQMRRVISDDMQSIAKQTGRDLPGACRAFVEHAKDVASEMQLAKTHPEMHKALMGL